MASSATFESVHVSSAPVLVQNTLPPGLLWESNIVLDDEERQYVNCALLDAISGIEYGNKFRQMEPIVKDLIEGQGLDWKDILIRRNVNGKRAVCIAIRTMQLIVFHGYKGLPWNETRRQLLGLFFPADVIETLGRQFHPFTPICSIVHGTAAAGSHAVDHQHDPMEVDVHTGHVDRETGDDSAATGSGGQMSDARRPAAKNIMNVLVIPRVRDNQQSANQRNIARWKSATGGIRFWRKVFLCAQKNEISLYALIEFLHHTAKTRRRKAQKGSINLVEFILLGLAVKRGTVRNFCDYLAIAMRTSNMETLVNVIRNRIAVPGVRCNLVPCVRTIKVSTAGLVRHFIIMCRPERTYSGFRVDLVAAVRLAAFLLLRITDLKGLRVSLRSHGYMPDNV